VKSWIVYLLLMGLVFVSPFMAIYLRGKKEIKDKKNFDILKDISLKNLQKIIKK
jgi:pilus assembly protein TadC